jgi:hypothetical protein
MHGSALLILEQVNHAPFMAEPQKIEGNPHPVGGGRPPVVMKNDRAGHLGSWSLLRKE